MKSCPTLSVVRLISSMQLPKKHTSPVITSQRLSTLPSRRGSTGIIRNAGSPDSSMIPPACSAL
ncbi:hypothetical protein D3C81_1700500 [compost metagenome]